MPTTTSAVPGPEEELSMNQEVDNNTLAPVDVTAVTAQEVEFECMEDLIASSSTDSRKEDEDVQDDAVTARLHAIIDTNIDYSTAVACRGIWMPRATFL